MKRLITIVTRAIPLVGPIPLSSSDTQISVAETSIPNDAVASSVTKASNSSSSATITITMYAGEDE